MNKLLTLSDEQVLDLVVSKITKSNPRIRVGARMTSPQARVWRGKHVDTAPRQGICLDFQVPHVPQPMEMIQAHSLKIHFRELENMEWSSFVGTWLYPYQAHVPHRSWLGTRSPGDTIMAMDDAWDASPLTLTEKHFTDHSYLVFRFGTSD